MTLSAPPKSRMSVLIGTMVVKHGAPSARPSRARDRHPAGTPGEKYLGSADYGDLLAIQAALVAYVLPLKELPEQPALPAGGHAAPSVPDLRGESALGGRVVSRIRPALLSAGHVGGVTQTSAPSCQRCSVHGRAESRSVPDRHKCFISPRDVLVQSAILVAARLAGFGSSVAGIAGLFAVLCGDVRHSHYP